MVFFEDEEGSEFGLVLRTLEERTDRPGEKCLMCEGEGTSSSSSSTSVSSSCSLGNSFIRSSTLCCCSLTIPAPCVIVLTSSSE